MGGEGKVGGGREVGGEGGVGGGEEGRDNNYNNRGGLFSDYFSNNK